MRELTFGGFLKKYLVDLSGQKGENLSYLAKRADNENPRLKEPLILYAYFCKEPQTVKRQFANSSSYKEFCDFSQRFKSKQEAMKYLNEDKPFDDYCKVYKSYIAKRDRKNFEKDLKSDIREEILSALNNKSVTAYMVVKEESLNLNKSNFYSFLRGNMGCLTISSAYNVMKYLNRL